MCLFYNIVHHKIISDSEQGLCILDMIVAVQLLIITKHYKEQNVQSCNAQIIKSYDRILGILGSY